MAAATTLGLGATLVVAVPAFAGSISGYQYQSWQFDVAPGATGYASSPCTNGGYVASGGFQVSTPMVKVTASYPDTDTSWRVDVLNLTLNTQTVYMRYLCVTGSVSYYRQPASVSVPANSSRTLTAVCPGGRTSMGGGFYTPNLGLITNISKVDGNGWQIRVRNNNTSAYTVVAEATCTTAAGRWTGSWNQTISSGNWGTFSSWCASGQVASGGGFKVDTDATIHIMSKSWPEAGWKSGVTNLDNVTHVMEYSMVCFPLT